MTTQIWAKCLYSIWSRRSPDAIDSVRDALFVASRTAAVEAMGGKPSFVEEHGVRYAEMSSPEKCAQYLRGALWNCWAANVRAMVWWCAFDQDNQTCAPYEWPEPCLELGIFRSDRAPYPAAGAEELAKDEKGSPVFFRNRYGKGTVYTLCLPLERLLHGTVGGYDCDAWRIYKTVLDVPQIFSAGSRDVMASVHRESDSKVYVVVVNNSPRSFEGRPVVADGWRVTASATDAPEHASFKDGTLKLDANSGILLTLEIDSNHLKE